MRIAQHFECWDVQRKRVSARETGGWKLGHSTVEWQPSAQRCIWLVSSTIGNQTVSVNLGSTAQKIHAAFHDYYYGMSEDEEGAIVALSNVPKSLIKQLSDIYYNLYSVNLNDEFLNYLSDSDYSRVSNLLN